MMAHESFDGLHVRHNRRRLTRIAERDGRRFEVRSSRFSEFRTLNFELRIAPFSYVSRFTRDGSWVLADFFSILQGEVSAGVELVLGVVDQADNVVAEISGLTFLGQVYLAPVIDLVSLWI